MMIRKNIDILSLPIFCQDWLRYLLLIQPFKAPFTTASLRINKSHMIQLDFFIKVASHASIARLAMYETL